MKTPSKPPAAPSGLAAPGRRLWRQTTSAYELDPTELALLAEAARSADELERLRVELAAAPSMVVLGSTGQPAAHPLLAAVRGHREMLGRLLDRLSLPDEGEETGRSPASQRGRHAARARWSRRDQVAERRAQHGALA